MDFEARALIDGRELPLADAALALSDDGCVRGDGAFETVGVWDGRAFRLEDHLDRLAGSLHALALPPADRERLRAEVARLLDGLDVDAALRIYVTASGTRVVTLAPQPQRPLVRRLASLPAPWIRPVGTSPLAGAKTMSYAANMTATRLALARGADDALLVALEGHVLEGPTFAVLWVHDEVLHAPAVDLGIVASTSRRTVLEVARAAGIEVREGHWPLAAVTGADEVLVCSAVRRLYAVAQVDDVQLPAAAPVGGRLAAGLERRRRAT